MHDQITVLMTTSPLPVHPSTELIEKAVHSIRQQLGNVPIHILADGVRPEQEHHRERYEYYLELVRGFVDDWGDVELVTWPTWQHQANLICRNMPHVFTPYVGFFEHDTELCGEIDWSGLFGLLESDVARLIRFPAWDGDDPPDYWRQKFFGRELVNGIPMRKTTQWSTWPHIAQASLYRRICTTYFDPACRTLMEGVMMPVLANACQDSRWDEFRVWMYDPGHRCFWHRSEGRGSDPMFKFQYAYPNGVVPKWAPAV